MKARDMEDLKDLGHFGIEIAEKAGNFVRSMWSSSPRDFLRKKGLEIITETDLRSQEILVKEIEKRFPEHGILAEEDIDTPGKSGYRWILDPLDGTTNFAHSYPCFCVSVGLEYFGKIVAGAVHDPIRKETFSAVKGNKAFLNGKQISVSRTEKVEDSLLCTGFPYDIQESEENNLDEFRKFSLCCQGVRRDGSAALDLCYVACGRFDGFWEGKLKPWDIAAASIIVTEAGGQISGYKGISLSSFNKFILATNGLIHKEMANILS